MSHLLTSLFSEKRRRWLGLNWAILGGLILAFVAVFAVSHYVFHVPVYEGNSNRLAPEGSIAMTLIALGAGGALFAVMGTALLLTNPRSSVSQPGGKR